MDEEDHSGMEHQQPRYVPPVARIPQASSQFPHYQQVTTQRRVYVAPKLTVVRMQQVPRTPMPPMQQVPPTPVYRSGVHDFSLYAPPKSFPGKPPCSIPGSRSAHENRTPGVSETLMGCGVLLAIGITILVVLYFISM